MRFISSVLLATGLTFGLLPVVSATVPASPVKSAATLQSAPVNLNTATARALQAVPGLTAGKARAIVAYRKHGGTFTSVDDLHKVAGFKRLDGQKWQEIKQKLTVS